MPQADMNGAPLARSAAQIRGTHGLSRTTRAVDAGWFNNSAGRRIGLRTSSPPQFGHTKPSFCEAQSRQNVHSKEQIYASFESGGRSRSQHSQFGRSSRDIIPAFSG